MKADPGKYLSLKQQLDSKQVTLVAVSKLQSVEAIRALYDLGHRDFGENYVQELFAKNQHLPGDIRSHFIGHLQSNKAKLLTGHVQLIQGVDSLRLLKEISRQALNKGIVQECLLQVHIAREESKFGLDEKELAEITGELFERMPGEYEGVKVRGLMGMASLADDEAVLVPEFRQLHRLFTDIGKLAPEGFDTLSMGMSGDYELAIRNGSTMVRIGSLLFGFRG